MICLIFIPVLHLDWYPMAGCDACLHFNQTYQIGKIVTIMELTNFMIPCINTVTLILELFFIISIVLLLPCDVETQWNWSRWVYCFIHPSTVLNLGALLFLYTPSLQIMVRSYCDCRVQEVRSWGFKSRFCLSYLFEQTSDYQVCWTSVVGIVTLKAHIRCVVAYFKCFSWNNLPIRVLKNSLINAILRFFLLSLYFRGACLGAAIRL